MISVIAPILILASLAATALASAASAAVPLVPRARVRRLVDMGTRGGAALDELQDRMSRVIGSSHLVSGVSYAGSSALAIWSLGDTYPGLAHWAAVVIGLAFGAVSVFTLGDALPRIIAVQNPEGVALAAARPALMLSRVAAPVAEVLAAPWRGLIRLVGSDRAGLSPWSGEDEVRTHSVEPEEEAAREETEERLLDAVADFTGMVVREVMVPRTDMTCIEDTATVTEAIAQIEKHGYSRLPVYHETVDDIVGVLYAKDLLLRVGRGQHGILPAAIARPPVFVPETKPVDELLLEMRATTHIAIVADEYGGTAGLVTIEDLIEEIVGEIFDEYDRQVPMIVEGPEGTFAIDARMSVDDLNDAFGTAIETEADTIAGLFTELAGHIPEPGERLEHEGLLLKVIDLEGTRIRHVEVAPAARTDDEEDNHAGHHTA